MVPTNEICNKPVSQFGLKCTPGFSDSERSPGCKHCQNSTKIAQCLVIPFGARGTSGLRSLVCVQSCWDLTFWGGSWGAEGQLCVPSVAAWMWSTCFTCPFYLALLKDVAASELLCPCNKPCEPEGLFYELSACCISALSPRILFMEGRAERSKGLSLWFISHCAEIATKKISQCEVQSWFI